MKHTTHIVKAQIGLQDTPQTLTISTSAAVTALVKAFPVACTITSMPSNPSAFAKSFKDVTLVRHAIAKETVLCPPQILITAIWMPFCSLSLAGLWVALPWDCNIGLVQLIEHSRRTRDICLAQAIVLTQGKGAKKPLAYHVCVLPPSNNTPIGALDWGFFSSSSIIFVASLRWGSLFTPGRKFSSRFQDRNAKHS